jgi:adenylate cyclase class 2
VRFHVPEPVSVIRRLRKAGIRFAKAQLQEDQAYAPMVWDYSQSRIGVTFARLRTEAGKHVFTVKRPVTDVRTCIEHECLVSDRGAMHEAILLMGYAPTIRIVKSRAMAQSGEFTFCLDQVDGLGWFLEVERLASAAEDTRATRLEIEMLLAEVGVEAVRCFDTYDALLHARDFAHDARIPSVRVVAA